MNFHFATAWERIADTIPDQPALICGTRIRTWREYDERAARFASVLEGAGLGVGAKVGIYLHNCNEYLEAQYGIFKIRGCPINVNYRYKADELVYLLDNADVEAVVYQACYAMRIWEIRERLPKVKLWVQVDDGTEALLHDAIDFERALRDNPPAPRVERAMDDLYMLYTGGTTGLPKGVMYNNGEFCMAMCMGYVGHGFEFPTSVDDLPELVTRLAAAGGVPRSVVGCPLMHGTGMWLGSFIPLLLGGSVVISSKLSFDPDLIWSLVEQHRATSIVIVGDAFARPMLASLNAARDAGQPFDLASLTQIVSSGVMWSAEVKEGLLEHHDMELVDTMGSTEGGMGSSVTSRDRSPQTARFELSEGVKVFSDDGLELQPGDETIGRVGTSGLVPIGYYKDPVKSAETFREIDGVRYSFPGDYARVEPDGSITLLGRGSVCINTAGEKVFPEEVEEVVKRYETVLDCLVVGVPDERFGERVVAVTSLQESAQRAEQEVIEYARAQLAGYKVPKHILFVDEVRRAPNGKPDYKWARRTAEAAYGA